MIEKIEEDLEEAEELGGAAEHPCAATPCLEGEFKKCAMAVEAWCAPVATGGIFPNGDPEVAPGVRGTLSSGARRGYFIERRAPESAPKPDPFRSS